MGRVVVLFHKSVPVAERITQLDTLGSNLILERQDSAGLYLIYVPNGTETEWSSRYAALGGVRCAGPEVFHPLA